MRDATSGSKKSLKEQRRGPETAGRLRDSWLPLAPPLPTTREDTTEGRGGGGKPSRRKKEVSIPHLLPPGDMACG